MNYIVYRPSGILRQYVKCIWTINETSASQSHCCDLLIPSGCVEIIFHYSRKAVYEVAGSGRQVKTANCVAGQRTRHTIYNSNENNGVLAVMLEPAFSNYVLGIPANILANTTIDSYDIWKTDGLEITEQIALADSNEKRFQMIEDFLLDRIRSSRYATDKRAVEFVKYVSLSGGNINLEEISKHLNISRRQLERLVNEFVGLSPWEFARIVKFQKSLSIKQHNIHIDLTSLAYESGYYDQSHFIREYKSITGLTPSKYFNSAESSSDYYSY